MVLKWVHPKLVGHAIALGAVCIHWAHLEIFLDWLLDSMLGIEDRLIFQTLAHNIDFREKLQIVAGLGFLKKPNERWFEVLKISTDQIDNDLRNRRNRFIHDRWGITDDGIKKIQLQTGTKKPQAFQPEQYYTQTETLVKDESVWQLSEDILLLTRRILILVITYRTPQLLEHLEDMLSEHAPLSLPATGSA